MATLDNYRQIVESVLGAYTQIPYAHGDICTEAVFDRENDRYLLVNVGWDSGRRVHGSLVHIDIIDGKLWIQRDGLEEGVATELIAAGIPRENMVLAVHPPEIRKHTGFAVA